jgi:hypothetical protein
MSLKVVTQFAGGNARDVSVRTDTEVPEVCFAAGPQGSREALWFRFRLLETEPGTTACRRLRLVLKYFETMRGAGDPAQCMPVYHPIDQGWFRMKHGQAETEPDGRTRVFWHINYPDPGTEVALCYPYGRQEIDILLKKSKGHWQADNVGLTQGGKRIVRLSSSYGSSRRGQSGLYLTARQNAGETPGSWVLDGVLQQFSRERQNPFLTWVVPLADMDGVVGRGSAQPPVTEAWGSPPGRHETLVLQRDMTHWYERCRPALALDFRSPGICDADGIFCRLPHPDRFPQHHQAAVKWANVIQEKLTAEYAAPDFRRSPQERPGPAAGGLMDYCCNELDICALTIVVPFSVTGREVLTQKRYREAGKRIAQAILRKPR